MSLYPIFNSYLTNYIQFVTIPNDAMIYVEKNLFTSDRLILSDRHLMADLDIWKDPLYCLKSCHLNGYAL